MATARKRLINLEETALYHCTSRCVRQAFLCGKNLESGQNLEHRKGWIETLLHQLPEAFCIEVAGYAVMSNHYHAVLRVDTNKARSLTDHEVASRWSKIFKVPNHILDYANGNSIHPEEVSNAKEKLRYYRDNLTNISKFIGYINEKVARRANTEDNRTGRFWESRFNSQAILDDEALLKTLVYVDLNPIRAGIAETPENSPHTSIFHRLHSESKDLSRFLDNYSPKLENGEEDSCYSIPISLPDYLELLDWTGREVHSEKRGSIDRNLPAIFSRLEMNSEIWIHHLQPNTFWQNKAIGSKEAIEQFAKNTERKWLQYKSSSLPRKSDK